jgi:hypothetical protein
MVPPPSASGVPTRGISDWSTYIGFIYVYIHNSFTFLYLPKRFRLGTSPDYVECSKYWQVDLSWKIGKSRSVN